MANWLKIVYFDEADNIPDYWSRVAEVTDSPVGIVPVEEQKTAEIR